MEEKKDNRPNTVYISFTGKDEQTVREFEKLLTVNNIPFRASTEKGVVKKISEFEREIGSSRITVIFYSKPYFESFHCMNEYALIRECKNQKDVFTVRCDGFKFDNQVISDLKELWFGRKGRYEDEGGDIANMREDLNSAYKYSFYVNKATDYSIHNLEKFFRDDNYYTPENWGTLVELLKSPSNSVEPKNNNIIVAAPTPSLPQMTPRDGIVPRDKEVDDLKNLLDENRLVNMIGLGGCGKSTISEYFGVKYSQAYHIVTSVVVSNDYYIDFVETFREAVGVPYKFNDNFKKNVAKTPNYKKTYDAIIEQLEADKYKGSDGRPNLIVIDVNETADYEPVGKELANFRSRLLSWKIIVVSRVKMCPGITLYEPLNVTDVDDKVLMDIFFQYLDRRRHDYYRKELNNHFSQLFTFLFRLLLLIEHLAYYLSNDIFDKTFQEILRDLKIDQDVFDKRFAGRNAKFTDKDKYEIIEDYLGTLIVFSKLDYLTKTGTLLRDIARHFAILPTGFYEADFIKKFIVVSDKSRIGEGLCYLVDKCILTAKKNKGAFQMHGLVAKSCRRQIYTLEDNKQFRDIDGFKQCVDSFDQIYNCSKQKDRSFRSAIEEIFTNIIPITAEEDNYVLRKAHQYKNQDIYEHILKVKLLRLQKVDESLFVRLGTEDFVKKNIDQLYYSWLASQPSKLYVEQTEKGISFIRIPINDVKFKMIKVSGLAPFYIGETQVTQGLWKAVMGNNPSYFKKGDNYPVENVSWYDCLAFIMELNKKTGLKFGFPTEKQWEFAASCNRKYEYAGTNDERKLKKYAWYGKNSGGGTHEVGTREANDLGLYDMSGNVSEWCKDRYKTYSSRVLRGGSWGNGAKSCRVSCRGNGCPDYWYNDFGLRLALPCSPFPG